MAYLNLGTKYNHGKKRINQLKTQRKASWFDVSFCHIPLPISQTTSNSTTTKKTVVKAIDVILWRVGLKEKHKKKKKVANWGERGTNTPSRSNCSKLSSHLYTLYLDSTMVIHKPNGHNHLWDGLIYSQGSCQYSHLNVGLPAGDKTKVFMCIIIHVKGIQRH